MVIPAGRALLAHGGTMTPRVWGVATAAIAAASLSLLTGLTGLPGLPGLTAAAGQRSAAAPGGGAAWTAPVTKDGHPDLQGYWTNQTYTPLERPPELAGKELFTEEEAAAYLKRRNDQILGQSATDVHYDDAIWQGENDGVAPTLLTSLIREPRDGRIPPLTAAAAAREARLAEARRARGPADGPEDRSLAERCISWGAVGPPMVPPTYNASLQILQTREYVVIRHEMIHEDRIIPLDGRPHLGDRIRLLAGDSRGRWEGNTLVVDTTNFTRLTNFRGAPRHTRQDIRSSDALHVVERFTRTGADQIRYQFTVNDPATWTRPWSGEIPIRKFDGPMYEYACHEGNYGLPNILQFARAEEKAAGKGRPPARSDGRGIETAR
jgi:hypothetical protein